MISLSTVETCAPVGFYVLWHVLVLWTNAWSRDNHLVMAETQLNIPRSVCSVVQTHKFVLIPKRYPVDLLDLSLGWWVSLCPYDMVCPYLHRQFASSLVSRLLAIIHSLTTLLDRMAYVTCPHVWSYQAWNQRKTYVEEKNLLILGHWTRV